MSADRSRSTDSERAGSVAAATTAGCVRVHGRTHLTAPQLEGGRRGRPVLYLFSPGSGDEATAVPLADGTSSKGRAPAIRPAERRPTDPGVSRLRMNGNTMGQRKSRARTVAGVVAAFLIIVAILGAAFGFLIVFVEVFAP